MKFRQQLITIEFRNPLKLGLVPMLLELDQDTASWRTGQVGSRFPLIADQCKEGTIGASLIVPGVAGGAPMMKTFIFEHRLHPAAYIHPSQTDPSWRIWSTFLNFLNFFPR